MNCERATLVAMLRDAETSLASACARRATAAIVRLAHEVTDLEHEITRWDRAYDARLKEEV